jgi:hypothetical protein
MIQANGGASHNIDLQQPADLGADYFVVASFHTHPNPPFRDKGGIARGDPRPSSSDLDNSAVNRVPGLVVTWPLSAFAGDLRGSEHPAPDRAIELEFGFNDRAPDTDHGTVFAYGPERRAGWCDDGRGFPKKYLADPATRNDPGGPVMRSVAMAKVRITASEYQLPTEPRDRMAAYVSAYRP